MLSPLSMALRLWYFLYALRECRTVWSRRAGWSKWLNVYTGAEIGISNVSVKHVIAPIFLRFAAKLYSPSCGESEVAPLSIGYHTLLASVSRMTGPAISPSWPVGPFLKIFVTPSTSLLWRASGCQSLGPYGPGRGYAATRCTDLWLFARISRCRSLPPACGRVDLIVASLRIIIHRLAAEESLFFGFTSSRVLS